MINLSCTYVLVFRCDRCSSRVDVWPEGRFLPSHGVLQQGGLLLVQQWGEMFPPFPPFPPFCCMQTRYHSVVMYVCVCVCLGQWGWSVNLVHTYDLSFGQPCWHVCACKGPCRGMEEIMRWWRNWRLDSIVENKPWQAVEMCICYEWGGVADLLVKVRGWGCRWLSCPSLFFFPPDVVSGTKVGIFFPSHLKVVASQCKRSFHVT